MADARDNGKLSASELGEAALQTVVELTGAQPEAVTGLEWDGDGEYWQVTVEVLELERIPNTTDVLASYAVQLDQEGTLRGYKRLGRFQRGQLMEG
jgi:Gas vesicle synthesis protein GvpO